MQYFVFVLNSHPDDKLDTPTRMHAAFIASLGRVVRGEPTAQR